MPDLHELRPGLHRWEARLPDWTPDQGGPGGWAADVACVAWESDAGLVLIDPLVNEGDWTAIDELASRGSGPVRLITTCPWHARSGREAAERYVNSPGIETWVHEKAAQDHERVKVGVDHVVSGRTQVVPGVEARTTDAGNGEISIWIEPVQALVAADVLIGAEGERSDALRVCPSSWVEPAGSVGAVVSALRPCLEYPIEAIVPLHGAPILTGAREKLAHALEEATGA